MRRLVPFVLLLPVLLVPAASPSSAEQVARCQGIRATIVGEPRQTLTGTPRADIIVTNGANRVNALQGNDRICVTRHAGFVNGGAGEDVVKVVVEKYHRMYVDLGGGRDVFIGGGHRDSVEADDGSRDVIRTGEGNDDVMAGGPEGMEDRVILGPGRDIIDLMSDRTIGDGHIAGGPGRDWLRGAVELTGDDVVIDARTGEGTRDGEPFLSFAALEDYSLDFERGARVTFVGSDRDEYADLYPATINGDLGGGDDRIFASFGPSGTEEVLSGGTGADRISLSGEDVDFDAATGSASGGPEYGTAVYDGFETLSGVGPTVTMDGSPANETLTAYGCAVTIRGLAGDDTLTSSQVGVVGDFHCDDLSSELFGGEGDDEMTGSNKPDILIGGEGSDSADGGKGDDVCEAETKVRCEG